MGEGEVLLFWHMTLSWEIALLDLPISSAKSPRNWDKNLNSKGGEKYFYFGTCTWHPWKIALLDVFTSFIPKPQQNWCSSKKLTQMYSKWNGSSHKWWEYFWHMKFLKNCVDISISSTKNAMQLTQIYGVYTNVFKMDILLFWPPTPLKISVFFIITHFYRWWCFSICLRGLLYSIGGEAERAHRLYQYFLRGCEG